MNIPEELQNKIITDAFIIKKNENNWLKIHNFLKSDYLKLKKQIIFMKNIFVMKKYIEQMVVFL